MTQLKGVWLVRSQPKESDGRLVKYVNFLNHAQRRYKIISWYRKGRPSSDVDDVIPYLKPAQTGARFGNALNLIGWNWYIFKTLFTSRREIGLIHATDFDTILPCLIAGKCLGIPVVYDIYDKYSASRNLTGVTSWLFDRLESLAIKASDHTILPHTSRYEQFGIPESSSDVTIIENVPIYSAIPEATLVLPKAEGVKYVLCYVGILEATHRGIEDLLRAVSKRPEVQLCVAGFGPLESEVLRYSDDYENIAFLGEVDRERAYQIMSQADIHVGMYYKTTPNHFYAAPNKSYEHLYFSKPLITTQGTPPGVQVEERATGWALAEGESSITDCIDSFEPSIIERYSRNAKLEWDNNYADYGSYFEKTYFSIIDRLRLS